MRFYLCFLFVLGCTCSYGQSAIKANSKSKFAIVIHGGAGSMSKENTTPEKEKAYKVAVQTALTVGYNILVRGGGAMDAVEAVLISLEDDSNFNAGKGAVFANDGKNELDASIMDGKTLNAGAVAGVRIIKNPITAARKVMEKTSHVMLCGSGAEQFATEQHLAIVSPSYFHTTAAWNTYISERKKDSLESLKEKKSMAEPAKIPFKKYGTVGAVAMDMNGNLAAGTSTGGMTNKMYGRIGDSPIIGAGTYADNNSCAVSCTGEGEYFIRLGMAKAVSDRVELKKMSVKEAADEMIQKKLTALGGSGGLIAIDKEGNITMTFNTNGMIRGYVKANGETDVQIYK